jgi:hypothetical protein
MQLINRENIEIVDIFTHIYGELLTSLTPHYEGTIEFKTLSKEENRYHDIMVRLGNVIYISKEESGMIGLTDTEMLAAIAHEIGHIVYNTRNWQSDCEHRADMLAAELGLGSQMIRAIEKILESRRYQKLTALLIQRIHFLQNMMRG